MTSFTNKVWLRRTEPRYRKLEGVIGSALVDRDLRALLVQSPGDVADSLNLSPEDREVLTSAKACSLEELAAYVQARELEIAQPCPRGRGCGWTARILAFGS